MPITLTPSTSLNDILNYLNQQNTAIQANGGKLPDAPEQASLENVVNAIYITYLKTATPDVAKDLIKACNQLANYGLPAAITHYTEHLKLGNWKKGSDGLSSLDVSQIDSSDLLEKISQGLDTISSLVDDPRKMYITNDKDEVTAIKMLSAEQEKALQRYLFSREVKDILENEGQPLNYATEDMIDRAAGALANGADIVSTAAVNAAARIMDASLQSAWKSAEATIFGGKIGDKKVPGMINNVVDAMNKKGIEAAGVAFCEEMLYLPFLRSFTASDPMRLC